MADKVLSRFDTLSGKKILFSLLDKDYLVVFQIDNCYKEYIIKIDNDCGFLFMKELSNDEELKALRKKRILLRRKSLRKLIESREILYNAFNNDTYSNCISTSLPNATYVAGVPSYFVIKDENNQICGEYSLSSITIPSPINPKLWVYLIKQLLDNVEFPLQSDPLVPVSN